VNDDNGNDGVLISSRGWWTSDRPMTKKTFNIRMAVIYRWLGYLVVSIVMTDPRRKVRIFGACSSRALVLGVLGFSKFTPLPSSRLNGRRQVLQSLFWHNDNQKVKVTNGARIVGKCTLRFFQPTLTSLKPCLLRIYLWPWCLFP